MTMDWGNFSQWGHRAADWAAEYHRTLRDRPVRPALEPGKVRAAIPDAPPEAAESMEEIFRDFEDIIVPGMTHWQHPRFHAYFPAGNSFPSILADMLSGAIGCVGFSWVGCHYSHSVDS